MKRVDGYSQAQVALHWIVVVLVAFQFVAHQGIEEIWRSSVQQEEDSTRPLALAYMHIVAGMLLLLLVLARLYLRFTRGVPPPPEDEPKLLQLLAESIHVVIYLLLVLLPLSGLAAWFLAMESAGKFHELLQNVLLIAIALHVSGALFQHFIRRSDVLMRMFRTQSR